MTRAPREPYLKGTYGNWDIGCRPLQSRRYYARNTVETWMPRTTWGEAENRARILAVSHGHGEVIGPSGELISAWSYQHGQCVKLSGRAYPRRADGIYPTVKP